MPSDLPGLALRRWLFGVGIRPDRSRRPRNFTHRPSVNGVRTSHQRGENHMPKRFIFLSAIVLTILVTAACGLGAAATASPSDNRQSYGGGFGGGGSSGGEALPAATAAYSEAPSSGLITDEETKADSF